MAKNNKTGKPGKPKLREKNDKTEPVADQSGEPPESVVDSDLILDPEEVESKPAYELPAPGEGP